MNKLYYFALTANISTRIREAGKRKQRSQETVDYTERRAYCQAKTYKGMLHTLVVKIADDG